MKGFVISVEGLIGLSIAFALLLSITLNFSESKFGSFNETKLSLVSEDVLTVLEKSGKLENAVKENTSKEISKYLNKTSKNVCFEVNLFDYEDSSMALSTATKKGCKKTSSVTSIKRSFSIEGKFYWAEMKAWHKVEE
jgi:hypothetical protein